MTVVDSPFGQAPVAEIPLPNAPLARVVSQVQFPRQPSLNSETGVQSFYESLRETYPIFRPERALMLVVTPEGVKQSEGAADAIWRLQDDVQPLWQITLGPNFAALETTRYVSRADFCSRLERLLVVLEESVKPFAFDRFGLRYVNRIEGPFGDQGTDYSAIREAVRPELLGGLSIPLGERARLTHTLVDSQFSLGDAQMRARWGMLPPAMMYDPTIPPTPEPSWILDIDVFTMEAGPFSAASLTASANTFAAYAYRFFRWSATDDLLLRHGAAL